MKVFEFLPTKNTLPEGATQEEVDRELFLGYAAEFYDARERVFADERMFYASVPIDNGLAYAGGFPRAPLGAYLKWWESTEWARPKDEAGREWFVCSVSGSPLSGTNRCLAASADGLRCVCAIDPFTPTAFRFYKFIMDYRKEKPVGIVACSLARTLRILKVFGGDEEGKCRI